MSDMIDYDDLRKKAEVARLRQKQYRNRYIAFHPESAEFLYSGPRMEHALAEHREAATPEVVLRLLDIIAVAKDVLENVASNYDHDADAHKYGTPCRECQTRNALDEIAKIEGEG